MNYKDETEFKILCPFCGTPYTAEMELELFGGGGGCETCGYGSEPSGTLKIKCSGCKKVVYVKEYEE